MLSAHRLTFNQPTCQLGVALLTRVVDWGEAALRAMVKWSASSDQEPCDFEMPFRAGEVEWLSVFIFSAGFHARALCDKELHRLEIASVAGAAERLEAIHVATVELRTQAQQPACDRRLTFEARAVQWPRVKVGAGVHHLWILGSDPRGDSQVPTLASKVDRLRTVLTRAAAIEVRARFLHQKLRDLEMTFGAGEV